MFYPVGSQNELENLENHVPAFNSDLAIAEIESAFGKTIKALLSISSVNLLLRPR